MKYKKIALYEDLPLYGIFLYQPRKCHTPHLCLFLHLEPGVNGLNTHTGII